MPFLRSENSIQITMSDYDYRILLIALGQATATIDDPSFAKIILELLNRMNQGNPEWVPYDSLEQLAKLEHLSNWRKGKTQ